MKDTTLIEILRTFSKEELKSMKKFLRSPFIKSRRNIGILFEYVIQYHPEFDSPKIIREKAFNSLFPGEEYSEKKIMNFISDLTEACKDFIMYTMLEKDEVESELLTSRGLYEKRLLNQSAKIFNKVESALVPGFSVDKNFFSKYKNILDLKNSLFIVNNDHKGLRENWNDYYEMAAVRFLVDYTWMMCSNFTTTHTLYKKETNNIIEAVAESFDIDRMLDLADKAGDRFKPITNLHSLILKTIREPKNTANYFVLKEFFLNNVSEYDREEKFKIISHLINICGENIVSYGDDFSKEMLEVYKSMLKNNAYSLSENEFLLVSDYRNIQGLTVLFKDSAFLELMIEEYSKLLKPEVREDIILFSYSYLHFLRNEFEKSLQMISKIQTDDFLFKTDIKKLKLFIFYELEYTEQAFSAIDSFKHYLSNSKEITDVRKSSSVEFISAFNLLLKIKTGKSEDNIAILNKKISNLSVFAKSWFDSKIDEFNKIKKQR